MDAQMIDEIKEEKQQAIAVIERARALLSYDPATGLFRWKATRARTAKSGEVAGTLCQGRRYIKLDDRAYLAHRLAYAMQTGALPVGEIDHADGNSDNNAWANLRHCTHAENGQNRRVSKRNKSGLLGVSTHGDAWQATICVNKKYLHLGRFVTAEAAHQAYRNAKRELHRFNPEVRP